MCAPQSHLNIHTIFPLVLIASILACSNAMGIGVPLQASIAEDVLAAEEPGQASAVEDASAREEKPLLIDTSSAPAAPTDNIEARIALRQHREATALNRFTFSGNVLEGIGDHVENWIVMFCPGWHEKCQGLLPSYELLGVTWENKLNKAVMSSKVRFAKVDCATEKAMCVSLDVLDYPSVVHYHGGQQMASWESGAPGLVRFIKQQLEPPKTKRRPVRKVSETKAAPACDAAGSVVDAAPACNRAVGSVDTAVKEGWHLSAWRRICLALMVLAAARYAYMLVSRARSPQTSHSAKHSPPLAVSRGGSPGPEGIRQRTRWQACLPEDWKRDCGTIVL